MSVVDEPSEAMIAEAARWLVSLEDDNVSAASRQAFRAWRCADPRHDLAVMRMASVFGSFDELPVLPAAKALRSVFARAESKRSSRPLQTLVLVGLLTAGWLGIEQAPLWLADQRTHVGERREISLADGSRMRLNSDSALDVHFDRRQRLIDLRKGEIWVDVAKNPARPFVVRTDQGTITALGTRFVVRKTADGSVQVSVLESAIAARAGQSADVRVMAGQQAMLEGGRVGLPTALGNTDPSAWTRGVLKVDDLPLVQVLQALASYRRGFLQFDRQALAGMRVSGVFRLDDSDAALAALADNLPIRIERFTDLLVRVVPKR